MSNAPTASKTATPPTSEPAKTITVSRVYFRDLTDLPGKAVAPVLTGSPRSQVLDADGKRINNQHQWLIEYTPAHRHFRIAYYPADKEKPEQVRMVHETAVKAWDPA